MATRKQEAKNFVKTWSAKEGREDAERQTFWNDLLQRVYGINDYYNYITYEKDVSVKADGKYTTRRIDGYIPSTKVMIEMKGKRVKDLSKPLIQSGGDLLTPFEQARRYSNFMKNNEKPNWILVSNFDEIDIHNMNDDHPEKPTVIKLKDLPNKVKALDFLVDAHQQQLINERQLSVDAGNLVAKIYDSLATAYSKGRNVNINDPKIQRSLNMLIVRLVFLFYADDTGILGETNMFQHLLEDQKPEDIRQVLTELFKVLDQPEDKRDPYLASQYNQFTYVNGGMFSDENIIIPQFTPDLKDLIIKEAGQGFDWSGISPTIFGAVFESTLNPETRRSGGMHYTSIENIHKVIDPLFLNNLRTEFNKIQNMGNRNQRIERAKEFQTKLGNLKFFDPACGSGNFLTETYLSLRKMENQLLQIIYGNEPILGTDREIVQVKIQNFYGIEINDFAVSVARTAMWIAENQMLEQTKDTVYYNKDFLPLDSNDSIYEGNALRMNWEDIVKPYELNYIMGNPPFLGYKYQAKNQKDDIKAVFRDEHNKPFNSTKKIDYVACWYFKAAEYIYSTTIKVAFVSTNSITQGDQVYNVWKPLLKLFNVNIMFAYRTFVWNNEAQNKANVHVVIVGFKDGDYHGDKIIYDDKPEKVSNINPYLINASNRMIRAHNVPLSAKSQMRIGCLASDGGNLVIKKEDLNDFIKKEPLSKKWIKRVVGGIDLLNNKVRYCLWLNNASPAELRQMPLVLQRMEKVKEHRLKSSKKKTREMASAPHKFQEIRVPESDYLAIPATSSERRKYIPIAWLSKDVIPLFPLSTIQNASLYDFGILESSCHMSWMRIVAGRLKSDYRYSSKIVYNTFPWPIVDDKQKQRISETAKEILDARKLYPDSSLADLYDPLTMPVELRKAHESNDKAVLKAFGLKPSATETEIVQHLFKMYEELTK
ncbi:N-6 DNA methylase [Limosilactobacillus reuteri]|uniref:DNA methyltransferase n=1 Tax=Limosilactobacillus reuteri TaxID=1598 RepID=UPI001E63127E|nr:DNA methyltransferase [Limosilactobacillus reuteri]MCC4508239.1 N-6 DNA methylase [Limosilactobacillus reuteri]